MILYFSGTGNSKYVAQRIADALGDTLFNINDRIKARDSSPIETGERIVFVTPTYAWRIPRIVQDWLLKTDLIGAKRAWFVMTCGSEIGNANKYNQALCETKHLAYMGTAEIVMPENYIALFSTPNSAEEVNHILAAAVPALEQTAAAIESGCPVTEPKPTVFGKFMTYIVNPIFYATCVHDRAFTVDDSCIGCGKCATLCPMNNIELQGGKPRWNGHCTHCMACISYCPKAAIAYGKKSRTRRIYTCPPYRPADR